MRKVVYILLITQQEEGGTRVGVGPVCWDRIEANKAMHSLEERGATVQVVERQVRGEMPEMRTSIEARPAYPERGE